MDIRKVVRTILVSLAIAVTVSSGACFGAGSETPSAWAADQIDEAIAARIVPELLRSNYTKPTTRAEFCALAVALYETVRGTEIVGTVTATDSGPVTEYSHTFRDTSDINVRKAAEIGVVYGLDADRAIFGPDLEINREQAAVILSRLLGTLTTWPLEAHEATFGDNEAISDWAVESVGLIQAAGIMQGLGENRFVPKGPYTREQSIVTALRLYNSLPVRPEPAPGQKPVAGKTVAIDDIIISIDVTALDLSMRNITDLSPLAELTQLTALNLNGNQITDITPLSGLPNLTRLSLSGNQIAVINPLADMTQLSTLVLNANQITDVSALANLKQLTRLGLGMNAISDISPLANLTQLSWLDLNGNPVSDWSAVESIETVVGRP
jgi:hypothetical protein